MFSQKELDEIKFVIKEQIACNLQQVEYENLLEILETLRTYSGQISSLGSHIRNIEGEFEQLNSFDRRICANCSNMVKNLTTGRCSCLLVGWGEAGPFWYVNLPVHQRIIEEGERMTVIPQYGCIHFQRKRCEA